MNPNKYDATFISYYHIINTHHYILHDFLEIYINITII